MRKPTVKVWGTVLLLVGLGLTIFFVVTTGPARIWGMLREAGWWVLAVAFAHFAYIAILAMAWRTLLHANGARAPFRDIFYYRWVADGSQALLPGPEVTGDVMRGYLLARRRPEVQGPVSAAVIIVELTLRMVSLILFIGTGLILLAIRGQGMVNTLVAGGILVAMLASLVYVQRASLLRKLATKMERRAQQERWLRFAGSMSGVDAEIGTIYGETGALARTAGWHFLGFFFAAAEIWMLLYAVHHYVGAPDVVVFESIGRAASNAGFFMPAGLGAQEGGYLLGARFVGLAAAVGVAISLLKRLRDVLVGLPALGLLWFREIRSPADREELREVTAPPIP